MLLYPKKEPIFKNSYKEFDVVDPFAVDPKRGPRGPSGPPGITPTISVIEGEHINNFGKATAIMLQSQDREHAYLTLDYLKGNSIEKIILVTNNHKSGEYNTIRILLSNLDSFDFKVRNGEMPIIKTFAGEHINEVGVPKVSTIIKDNEVNLKFDYLKGEFADVDSELNTESENPIQNNIVTKNINNLSSRLDLLEESLSDEELINLWNTSYENNIDLKI